MYMYNIYTTIYQYIYLILCSIVYRDSKSLLESGEWLGTSSSVADGLVSGRLSKESVIEFLQSKADVRLQ